MNMVVSRKCLALLEKQDFREQGAVDMRLNTTYVLHALREPGIDMSQNFGYGPLCCGVVPVVQRGGVNESEGVCLERVVVADGQLDVDGDGPDMGGEAAAALDELCDAVELLVGGGGRNKSGVEEETEEGGLAGASASDHESVCGGVIVRGRGGRGLLEPGWEGVGGLAVAVVDVAACVVAVHGGGEQPRCEAG
jgi:hypothetical protein